MLLTLGLRRHTVIRLELFLPMSSRLVLSLELAVAEHRRNYSLGNTGINPQLSDIHLQISVPSIPPTVS